MNISKIVILLFLLLLCSPCFGATYYIDHDGGADTNNGTATSTPWAHCPGMDGCSGSGAGTCGGTTLAGDDIVVFKGGVTWTASTGDLITVGSSGTLGHPITFVGGQRCGSGGYICNSSTPWGTGYPELNGNNVGISITMQGKDHLTFDGLKTTNNGVDGTRSMRLWSSANENAGHIEVKNCWVEGDTVNGLEIIQSGNGSAYYIHDNHFKNNFNVLYGLVDTGETLDDIQIYNNIFEGADETTWGGWTVVTGTDTKKYRFVGGVNCPDYNTTEIRPITGAHFEDWTCWKELAVGDTRLGPDNTYYIGVSSDEITVGTGDKTFNIATGLTFSVGQTVRAAYTTTPTTVYMTGAVKSYNSETGALVLTVSSVGGSGTQSSWQLGTRLSSGTHPDGIQLSGYSADNWTNVKIYNNQFRGVWYETSTSLGVYLQYVTDVDVYNNIMVFENTTANSTAYQFSPGAIVLGGGTSSNINIYNNTIVSDAINDTNKGIRDCINLASNMGTVTIKNNIFSQCEFGIMFSNSTGTTLVADNNLYYKRTGGHIIRDASASTDYDVIGSESDACTVKGWECSGQAGNPNLKDVTSDGTYGSMDVSLQATSTLAIGNGVNLGAACTGCATDIAGTVRGAVWDIGAYEYQAGSSYSTHSFSGGSSANFSSGSTVTWQ